MPPPADGFATRFVLGPALRTQPDRRLVALVREGYENAFEEIVRRYGRPLTRYAAAIVGSRGEDVTQDAFSKALLALRRDDAEIELRPWLFRIVRNTALNDLRDRPPTAELLAEAIPAGGNPAEEFERREELADLTHRLRSLPEPQRAAIVMRELEGLSHEEIAAALGLSGGAARQAIYRARRTLRDGLGLLLPLPLLKALLAGGAFGGAEVATAGVAGAGGVGVGAALKTATVTVLVAGAVGTGVAIQESRHGSNQAGAQPQRAASDHTAPPAATVTPSAAPTRSTGRDSPGGDDDDRGPGSGDAREGGDDSGRGHGNEDHSGPGRAGNRDRDEDEEANDDRSGPGDDGEDEDRSGSSHGGDDDDFEDHSGSGGGSAGDEEPEFDDDDSGSSSSGSGSGDDDLDDD